MFQLSSSPLDRIFDLKDEAEKQKVELTSEVKAYIQTHIEIVQEKLSKGEAVTEEDMQFVDDVMMWVVMPEEWMVKYPSIGAMKSSDEMKNVGIQDVFEAKKRHITIQQWFDLLHLADSDRQPEEWIDEKFQFPGGRKIEAMNLLLMWCTSITHLPENLNVGGYLNLSDSTSLRSLPKKIEIDGDLILSRWVQKKVQDDAERLKNQGKIKGKIEYF